ncbi:hypothetical protein ACFL45_11600 [Candidatus Neomarinimicrobiota bacterium]
MLKRGLPIIFILMAGMACSSSRTVCVRYDLGLPLDSDIAIMPFSVPDTTSYAITLAYFYYDPKTQGQISKKEMYRTSKDYRYTFELDDFIRLRSSLIQSLDWSDGFHAVRQVNHPDSLSAEFPGYTLEIDFRQAGIRSENLHNGSWGYICFLDSRVILKKDGQFILNKDLYVEEISSMSVTLVKQRAIRSYLGELGNLLSVLL